MVLGLWQIAYEAFAANTGGIVHLDRTAVMWITGRTQFAHASRALRALCARLEYAVSAQGALTVVEIRNFQQKQASSSALRTGAPRTPSASDSDSDSGSSPVSSSLQTPPPQPPASGGSGARLEPPLMKPEKAPRYVLAARRGWPAAQRAAAELGNRTWGDLRPGKPTERWAARACELAEDDSGATLERLVRGGFRWWSQHLPANSENTAHSMLEPPSVLEVKNHEKFLAAFAEGERRAAPTNEPLTPERRAQLLALSAELRRTTRF